MDDVTKNREGESAFFQIGGDQRIEGLKSHGHRDVGVAELNLAERIGGFEAVAAKAGEAVPGLWGAAMSFVTFEGQGAFQETGARALRARHPSENREGGAGMIALRHISFGRPIHEFEILEISTSSHSKGASADPANGKRDPAGHFAFITAENRPLTLM